MRYDADGVAMPDVSYTYADAVRDGICRPVTFIPYDGMLQWRTATSSSRRRFDDALVGARGGPPLPDRDLDRPRRRAAADPGPAHARLQEARAAGHRDAGGLVVTADSEHARAVAKVLREVTGVAPTVVLHTDTQAARRLQEFARSTDRWIVAVNMVSEGVDIPRLRVGVYATAAQARR